MLHPIAAWHDSTVYTLSIMNGKRLDYLILNQYDEYKVKFNSDLDKVVETLADIYGLRHKNHEQETPPRL